MHLLVLHTGSKTGYRTLSFNRFIQIIRDQYGFYVDQAPPGLTISNELLRVNRVVLERRLRDLGLLIGVNDAESMKLLRGRFERSDPPSGKAPTAAEEQGIDEEGLPETPEELHEMIQSDEPDEDEDE